MNIENNLYIQSFLPPIKNKSAYVKAQLIGEPVAFNNLINKTTNYPSNDSNVNIIKHINLNEFNEEERKNLLLRFNKLNIHWDYINSFKVDYKSKEFNLLVWEKDLNIMNEEINKIKEGN